jgi:signal transduction histidine kinase
LGLLLSHKIVQEHGGEIRVQSSPQQGAVFQVILPRRVLTEPAGSGTSVKKDGAKD